MRFLLGFSFFLIPCSVVIAQNSKNELPLNEFRHQGGTIVCFTDEKSSEGYLPCLHLSGLAIGQKLGETEEKIKAIGGNFNRSEIQNTDLETRVYLFETSKREMELAYLAVTYSKERVEAIQLTGNGKNVPLTFSSIQLGDSSIKVIGLIGPPNFTEPLQDIDGTLWEYRPFPFSIEFKNGKVYSIRIQAAPITSG